MKTFLKVANGSPDAKGGATQRGLLCPCVLQLPLVYNDGRKVARSLVESVMSELDQRFNGCTLLGRCVGYWRGQQEPSVRIEVAVAADRVPELKSFVRRVGELLGQECIYFDHRPPSVELLPILDPADPES